MSTLHTTPIPAARTVKLSDRRDGTTGGRTRAKLKPGEILPIKIDACDLAGAWLKSIDNISIAAVGEADGSLTATDSDTFEGSAIVNCDASDAVAGDLWQMSFQLHPTPDQTVCDSILVEIESPSLT